MMEFEGKDKVLEKVQEGQTLLNLLQQMNQQMQQMAALLQAATGVQAEGAEGSGRTQSAGGSGRSASRGSSLGAEQSRAMTAGRTPYAQQLARRAAPDMGRDAT